MNLRKILQYSTSNLLIQLLNLVFSVLVVGLLSLPDLGKYNLAKGLSLAFQYTSLSFRYGLDRRLPRISNKLGASQLASVILINGMIAVVLLLSLLFYYRFDPVFTLYCAGGLIFSVFSLYKIFFRSTGQLKIFVQSNLVAGLTTILLPLAGLWFYGLLGLALGYFIACLAVTIIYGRKYLHLFRKVTIHKPYLKKIFFVGLPIYVSNLFVFFGDYLDRFMIDYFINRETVGEFSVVILLYSVMILVPSSILEMTYPDYIRKKDSGAELRQLVSRHVKLNLVMVGVVVAGVLVALPYAFEWLFPRYLYLLPYCYMICLAVVPSILIPVFWALLFTFDKGYGILRASGVSLLLYLAGLLILLNSNFSFYMLVWAKVLFSYIYLGGLLYYVFRFKLHKILLRRYDSFVAG